MGLGEQHRHWDSGTNSPYLSVSDSEDKKVMDLSVNYSIPSPMMVCNGNGSPPPHHPHDTVLRLGVGHHHRPVSPVCGRRSPSPQPNRSVITSVSSHHLQHPSSSSSPHEYKPNMYYMPGSPLGVPAVRHSTLTSGSHHPQVVAATSSRKKKLPQPIPEECKDDAYWERRKRNNESAKRSREMRRSKEIQTQERVQYLENENLQLRTEVSMLRNEVEKLRQLLIPKSAINS